MGYSRWSCKASFLAAAVLVAASPAAAVKRRAFVTSVAGTGNLASWPDAGGQTGLAAGDAICRARATAAGLPNANTYRAWLSTATTDAYCHVQGLSGERNANCGQPSPPETGGPWYLVNGLSMFTGSLPRLTSTEGLIYRPVGYNELGVQLGSDTAGFYWTGTTEWGMGNSTCGDWTSASSGLVGTVGSPQQSARGWSLANNYACNQLRPLLCLEPGASDTPPTVPWTPGALAFISSAQGSGNLAAWPQANGASGLAAGDEICRSLAAAAHLPAPSSFRAWLSDAVEDAAERITLDAYFQRVDGFVLAPSRAVLLSGVLPNSLHVDESGHYLATDAYVWTGTDSAGVADPMYRCADWTDGTSGSYGTRGAGRHARSEWWTEQYAGFCSDTGALYCFANVVTLFWDGFDYTGDTSRWSSVVP